MKKLGCIGLALLLSFSVGCGKKSEETAALQNTTSEIETQEEVNKLTEENFKEFFDKYFSLSEQDMLVLNRNYQSVSSDYWANLKIYQKRINETIGKYLAEDVKQKISEHYLNSEIELPKKMMINEYITYGEAKVENIEITSTRPMGENLIYELAVTTDNKVQRLSDFIKDYVWVEDSAYYALKSISPSGEDISLVDDVSEAVTEVDNYIYAKGATPEEKDEIKLVQKYWVEVEPKDTLKIKSIQEADTLTVDDHVRMKVNNTQHASRIPYYSEVSDKEKAMIKEVFTQLMGGSKAFYDYYDKAVDTSYVSYKELWKDMGLLSNIILEEKSYTRTFGETINPYKDNIIKITVEPNAIQMTPSLYDTKMQPRFVVSMPIKALLSNNEIVYYNYKYFVGMDGGKIEFIEFMNMESLTEEAYKTDVAAVQAPKDEAGDAVPTETKTAPEAEATLN